MKKFTALLLALMMVLGVLSGCAKEETPELPENPTEVPAEPVDKLYVPIVEANSYKKDVVVGTSSAFTMLDPHGTYNVSHNTQTMLVYDTLISWNSTTQEAEPELATEWKWVNDTTMNIKMRDDVYFHNGEKLTADDVKFSFERLLTSKSTGATNMKMITEYEIISDYELNIKINEINMDFLAYLAQPYCAIINREACEKDPENGMHIGSGPWIYVDMAENDYMKLKRNDNYWREKPKSETLTIRTIPENSTRLIALQNNEIDLCLSPNNTELDIIKADQNLKLNEVDRTSMYYFAFNTRTGPGADHNFRMAVAYAIDEEELLIVGADGLGKLSNVNWGWSTYGYDATLPGIDRDLDKAKEYLAKTEHRKIVLSCTSTYKMVCETIQAQLRAVGITVEINEVQSAAMTAMSKFAVAEHEAMVYSLSWNEYGDDCRRPYYKDSNVNKAIVENQEIWDLIDAAKKEFDDAKRKEMYSKIQKINLEQCYYLPLYFAKGFVAMNKNAGGVRLEPNNTHDFSYFCVAEK